MGLAISGMHYTGMAAASFPAGSICLSAGAIGGGSLYALVVFATFTLLAVTLLMSIFDARINSRTSAIARSLQVANAEIVEEQKRFRALLALSTDWFWEQDSELRFIAIRTGDDTPSIAAPRGLGKHAWELGSIGDWEAHRAVLARRESFRGFEVQRRDAQGNPIVTSTNGSPIFDAQGTFIGYRGVGRDITAERRRSRREALHHEVIRLLAESTSIEEVLARVLRMICERCEWPGGMFVPGPNSLRKDARDVRWARDEEEELFARLADAGASVRDALARESGLHHSLHCRLGTDKQAFGSLAFYYRTPGWGDAAMCEAIATIGLHVGLFIARVEAEAEVRAERELLAQRVEERTLELREINRDLGKARVAAEDANRAKSAFLATMSHEIRTPMNGVIGMIEILARSALSEEQRDAVRTIRTSAFSLLSLIDDILDFSKIEAGRLQIEHAPVSLAEIAESVCDLLAPEAASRGVELRLFVAPDLPERIWSDATRLRQALGNLVTNAVKFSGGRADVAGRVSVRIERDRRRPRCIALRVVDNGIGISGEKLGHLFAPFTQAEASTTRRYGGTGLGLVICKRIAALLGGDVDVDSIEGVGSTFTLTLPFEAVEGQASVASADLGGLDCVVVAAPLLAADDLRAYLEHAGAAVHVAASANAAAARVAAGADSGKTMIVIERAEAGADAPATLRQRFAGDDRARHVVLVPQGKAMRAELLATGLVTLGESGLRRASLLRAVALAAGRESAPSEPGPEATLPNAATLAAPTVKEARANRRLILVAEDDTVNQKVILMQLSLLGHAAEVAGDGEEALQLWREGGYALLLSDLHMPRLDGYGLTAAIREAEALAPGKPRLPIVALTANAMRDEGARVRAIGMDEYLTKPVQLTTLERTLARWLPRPSGAAALDATANQASGNTATRGAARSDEAAIELSVLANLVGNDPATIRDFLAEFLQVARQQGRELADACERGDLARAGSVAHKLKASSRSIGALALGDLCAELENASKAGSKAEVDRVRFDFERVLAAVDAGIVALLAAQPA
jgi:signal transduction histidine kinase/CheY-like chemotaxis protein/HPt (histidine-containing phosphotransfer) domain-containing protein